MEIIHSSTTASVECKIAERAKELIQHADKEQANQFKLFDQYYKDYMDICDRGASNIVNGANFSDPLTSTICDAVIPRVIEDVLDFDNSVMVNAVSKAGNQYRDHMMSLIQWDLDTMVEKRRNIYNTITNSVIYGTGFGETYFKTEQEIIEIEEDLEAIIVNGKPLTDADGNLVIPDDETLAMLLAQGAKYEQKKAKMKEKRWKCYYPWYVDYDIHNVYFSPDATSMNDAWENGFVAVKFYKTVDAIKKFIRDNDSDLYRYVTKELLKTFKEDDSSARNELFNTGNNDWMAGAVKTKKLPFYKVFLNMDVDGDGYDEKIVAIYNSGLEKTLGWEKYQYKHGRCPVVAVNIYPVPHKVYGRGLPDKLYSMKAEVDELQNAQFNRQRFYENPILMYRKGGSGFNPARHKFTFGAKWDLDSLSESDIRFFEPPRDERNTEMIKANMYGLAQKRSGITDYSLGVESSIASNRTASGISQLIQEGSVIIRQASRSVADGIKEIMQQTLDLYKQYWGEEADEEIQQWIAEIFDTPDNPFSVQETLAGLQHKFNTYMTVSKQDKKAQIARSTFVHEVIVQDPFIQQFPPALRHAKVELLRANGIKNPEQWYPTDEQIKQYQIEIQTEAQKQAMMQMQQEQAQAQEQQAQQFQAMQMQQEQAQQDEAMKLEGMQEAILDNLVGV